MLLDVNKLAVTFRVGGIDIPAVADATLRVDAGETVALVGESGCGKSVTAMALTQLPPTDTAAVSGVIEFNERQLKTQADFASVRGSGIAYVFQEAQSSLNPVMRVGAQLAEIVGRGRKGRRRGLDLLSKVELPEPEAVWRAFPCELSGGMQQRVVIAMALACEAQLIVADEPTTALDVTTQAKVLDVLELVRSETGTAVLLITHNLGLVAEYASRVYVMYAGSIVESGPAGAVLRDPAHPYTRGLLNAVPKLDAEPGSEVGGIAGRVPAPELRPTDACVFADRCERRRAVCLEALPEISNYAEGRDVRCCFPGPKSGRADA